MTIHRAILACVFFALGGCGVFGGSSYRYKMTVEVDTPQGVVTGSAVREITYTKGIRLPDASGVSSKQRGEAVAVDLPGGQVLFALLPADGYVTLQAAFGDDSDATLNAAHKDKRIADLRPIAGRIPEQSGYPMLVTFGDLTDPTSVALVAPDNLAASFGEGVTLRRITVQMTDEDVTSGIGARLQAIGINIHHGLDDVKGVTATPTLAQQLGYGNFSTESIK